MICSLLLHADFESDIQDNLNYSHDKRRTFTGGSINAGFLNGWRVSGDT